MAKFIDIKHNIPKSLIDTAQLQKRIDAASKRGAEKVATMLTKTVSTWEEPPIFVIVKTPFGYGVNYDARTKGGKHFTWVSGGTKAHTYSSPAGSPMTFEWRGKGNYPAKTHVGSMNPYKGVSAKNLKSAPWVRLYQVRHPGIWPRDFAGLIMAENKDYILKEIQSAVRGLAKTPMYGPRLEK